MASPGQWPDAFRGFPAGRPPQTARAFMLDLAHEGRSSQRYPVAPDGEIPNSVVRQLFSDTQPGEPRVHFVDGFRRRSTAVDTAERAHQQLLAEAERDWLNSASLEDLEAALESRRKQIEQQLQQQEEPVSLSQSQSQSQSQAQSQAHSPTHLQHRRNPRQINLRTLPPIGREETASASAAAEEAAEPAEAQEQPPRAVSVSWTRPESPVEVAGQPSAPDQQPLQPGAVWAPAQRKRKPVAIKKKTKKPNAGLDRTAPAASGASTEAAPTEEKSPPPKPPSAAQPQEPPPPPPPPLDDPQEKPRSQPPAPPQPPLPQPPALAQPSSAKSERTRRVQFGDPRQPCGESALAAQTAVAATTVVEKLKDPETELLERILAEPWFALPETPPLEKAPVTRGLLLLMKFTVSLRDHEAMCDRVRDIAKLLTLDEALRQSVIAELTSHLQAILDQSKEAGNLSDQRLSLMIGKGDNTLSLLVSLGFGVTGLIADWGAVKERLLTQIAESAEAAAAAAAAAAAEAATAAAAEAEAQLRSQRVWRSASQSGGAGQRQLRDEEDADGASDSEAVRPLFEVDLVARLTRLRSSEGSAGVGGRGSHVSDDSGGAETSHEGDYFELDGEPDDEPQDEDQDRLGEPMSVVPAVALQGPLEGGSSGYGSLLDTRETTVVVGVGGGRRRGPVNAATESSDGGDGRTGTTDGALTGSAGHGHVVFVSVSDAAEDGGLLRSATDEASEAAAAEMAAAAMLGPQPLTAFGEEPRSDTGGSGSRSARPMTASARSSAPGTAGSGRSRPSGGRGQPDEGERQWLQPSLPDLFEGGQLHGKRAAVGNSGPALPQAGLYEEFIPGSDNVFFGSDGGGGGGGTVGPSSGRATALLLSIDRKYSPHGRGSAEEAATREGAAGRPAKRVTIQTPTQMAMLKDTDVIQFHPTRCEPFSFMTRSRTEPKLCASSVAGRPSYVSSRDWGRLAGSGEVQDDTFPTLAHRLAWPEHCRMDNLARRGLHKPGISISRHLDRYTLIETVSRGVRLSIQKHAELSLARSSTSLQSLSTT